MLQNINKCYMTSKFINGRIINVCVHHFLNTKKQILKIENRLRFSRTGTLWNRELCILSTLVCPSLIQTTQWLSVLYILYCKLINNAVSVIWLWAFMCTCLLHESNCPWTMRFHDKTFVIMRLANAITHNCQHYVKLPEQEEFNLNQRS